MTDQSLPDDPPNGLFFGEALVVDDARVRNRDNEIHRMTASGQLLQQRLSPLTAGIAGINAICDESSIAQMSKTS
jgi:hypothetical protein